MQKTCGGFGGLQWVVFAAILELPAFCVAASQGAEPPRVHMTSGVVSGVQEGSVAAFLGIPYAQPPVGRNRWHAPQPVARWTGVRAADRFGASCYQAVHSKGLGPWTHEYLVKGVVSEDCLYLNVWTTKSATAARRPVFVWLHGGSFVEGSGSVEVYDGAALARKGVVVVTVNYRLGIFGFLSHPDLTREVDGGTPPGNYGLQDIIAALKWVRTNIAAFGGDPDAVTVAGQSAGAMAVHDLLVSPLASNLFQRAVAESGLPDTFPLLSLADAERGGTDFGRRNLATSAARLRAIPAAKLLAISADSTFSPIVDGVLLPDAPAKMATSGESVGVPILIGMNADENSSRRPVYEVKDVEHFSSLLQKSYGDSASRFEQFYRSDSDAERLQSSHRLLRDRGLGAIYTWARQRVKYASGPVFVYLFTHVEPGADSERYGAFHSSEIPYVFDTMASSPERGFTTEDQDISRTISSYWVNFAKTGDPNGAPLPRWPGFSVDRPQLMEFAAQARARPLLPPEHLRAVEEYVMRGGELGIYSE